MEIILVLALFIGIAMASRYGADSRDGMDWTPRTDPGDTVATCH